LQPGDEVPEASPDQAFGLIIRPDEVRGIDAAWTVLDPEAYRASLVAAGQGPEQVSALVDDDVSLDQFVQLMRSEVLCVQSFGLATTPVTVQEDLFGFATPGYSFSAGSSGYTDGQISFIQAVCQNRWTGAYASVYRARFGPSAQEEQTVLAQRATVYIECVRREGGDPPFDTVTEEDLDAFFAWFATDETPGCNFEEK
jgi:hypothetical protein